MAWRGMRIVVGDVVLRALQPLEVDTLIAGATLPDAVLPPEQSHYVTWLTSAQNTEGRIRAPLVTPEHATLGAPCTVNLGVLYRNEVVGQVTIATGGTWPSYRAVYTSSWVLRNAQRQGVGLRARVGAVTFAFEVWDAVAARSHVLVENAASIRVSERLGYQPVSRKVFEEDGRTLTEIVYEVSASAWSPPCDVIVEEDG